MSKKNRCTRCKAKTHTYEKDEEGKYCPPCWLTKQVLKDNSDNNEEYNRIIRSIANKAYSYKETR